MDESKESLTVKLPDGRTLGYSDLGDPTGKAVLHMHGLACSRLDGLYYSSTASSLGIRLITIDRPGMGLSTPQPNRTVLSFAKDVEFLTQHLQLDKYAIMGQSGGGPSVLACAYTHSSALRGIAMISALGPPDIGMSGARLVNRIGFPYGYRLCPPWLNKFFWRHVDKIGQIEKSDEERLALFRNNIRPEKMDPKEAEVFADERMGRTGMRSTREGFAQGYDGVLLDGRLCCRPFGFKIEDIRKDLRVGLWYGTRDVLVPKVQGVEMKKRFGEGARLEVLDETHSSLGWRYGREILEDLVKDW